MIVGNHMRLYRTESRSFVPCIVELDKASGLNRLTQNCLAHKPSLDVTPNAKDEARSEAQLPPSVCSAWLRCASLMKRGLESDDQRFFLSRTCISMSIKVNSVTTAATMFMVCQVFKMSNRLP